MPARHFYRTEARRSRTQKREEHAWLWDSPGVPPRGHGVRSTDLEPRLRADSLDAARRQDQQWRRERARALQRWVDAAWGWETTGHRRFRLGALGMLSGVAGSFIALMLPLFTAGFWMDYLAVAGFLLLVAGLVLFAFGWLTETTAASARRWLLASARRSDAPVRDPSRGE